MAEIIDAHGNLLKADMEASTSAPEGAPDAADMVISTPRPKLTTAASRRVVGFEVGVGVHL